MRSCLSIMKPSNSTEPCDCDEGPMENTSQHQILPMTAWWVYPDGYIDRQNPVTLLRTPTGGIRRNLETEQRVTQVIGLKKATVLDMDVDIVNVNPAYALNHVKSQDNGRFNETIYSNANSSGNPTNIISAEGFSIEFNWCDNFNTFESCPEVFTGPTPGAVINYNDIYDAFKDIWDETIMVVIVTETNKHAEKVINEKKAAGTLKDSSRMHRWYKTNVKEMYLYFAMHIVMASFPLPYVYDYWSPDSFPDMPWFGQLMAFNRFTLLNKFLHFMDSYANQGFNHTGFLPVLRHLEAKFSNLYNLQKDITIQHSLTLSDGRLSSIKTKRSGATRFGVKFVEICESRTGYAYKFEFYSPDKVHDEIIPGEDFSASTIPSQVVLNLLKDLDNRGHCVTVENFDSSPLMARCLKKMGFDCLGSIDPNGMNVPKDIKKALNRAPKGDLIARHSGDISCIAWKQSKIVAIVSTYHHSAQAYADETAGKNKTKVDFNNQTRYLLERKKSCKWHIAFFKGLLNISVNNALILLSSSLQHRNKPFSKRDVRLRLARTLIEVHGPSAPGFSMSKPVDEAVRLRKDLSHIAERKASARKRCHVCLRNGKRQMTRYYCVVCDEFLCIGDCWKKWHSLQELGGRVVKTRKCRRK